MAGATPPGGVIKQLAQARFPLSNDPVALPRAARAARRETEFLLGIPRRIA
jgi:hypothetical protein